LLGPILLFLAKIAEVVLFPFFFVYIAWEILSFSKKGGGTLLSPRWLAFLLPVISLVAVQALWNYIRYSDWTDIGLKSTWGDPVNFFQLSSLSEGLSLFLYQPDKSIFIFSPPLLLFIPGWIIFFDKRKREALLFGIIILFSILFYSTKFDPGQVGWWGPKYLVFLTPIAILPIGSLLTIDSSRWRRLWYALAGLTGLVGLGVQIIGVLVDDRQYADLSSNGIDLLGAARFLSNGVIDSLIIYLSPTNQWLQINPYAIVMVVFSVGLAVSILWMALQKRESRRLSFVWNMAIAVLVLSIQFIFFTIWIIAPYPQVRVAQANTNFVAGNLLLASRDMCKASQLYLMALEGSTDYENVAVTRVNELLPHAQGESIGFDTMTDQIERNGNATVQLDTVTALSEEGSIKITLDNQGSHSVSAVSSSIPIQGNQIYELSGWIKTQALAGEGSVAFVLYEDNGNWGKPRNTDIALVDAGAHDWIPFWKTITTLPTSKRIIVKAGFSGARGVVWFDRLQIARITNDNPKSITPTSCSQTK